MKLYVDDPIKGKVLAGELNDDKSVFLKKVKRSKHYFRLVSGYAMQMSVYRELIKLKVKMIIIDETDTKNLYFSTLKDWDEHGAIWTGKNGKQRTLSIKYMKESYA